MKIFDYALETKALSDETGEFEGYASTFKNVDQGGDYVEPGAFIGSVHQAKKDGRVIPLLWQHDATQPIGVWKDIAEDAKGLYVKGQLLVDADPLAKRAHALLKAKALGGMSIGYMIPQGGAEWDEKRRANRLVKVDLREVSLVTMPMNIEARVTAVKSILTAENPLATFEDFLRDAGGFSRKEAKAIAAHGLKPLINQRDADGSVDEDEVRKFLAALR